MARQKDNSVMHNTRGMFNKQVVFKERGGRVYVAEAGAGRISSDQLCGLCRRTGNWDYKMM